MQKITAAIVLLLIFSTTSFAAHPLITDDAGTMGRNSAQAEFNGEFSVDKETDDGATTEVTSYEASTTLTYGVTDNVDFVLGIPYQWSKTEEDGSVTSDVNGLSDLAIELKWSFHNKDGMGISLKPGISIPIGDEEKGLGNGKASYSLLLITSLEREAWAAHFNMGYMRNEYKLQADEDANRKDLWHISAACSMEIVDKLTAVANLGIEKNSDKTSDTHPAFILGGIIYSLSDGVDIDFGIKAGLNKQEADYSVLAGVVVQL